MESVFASPTCSRRQARRHAVPPWPYRLAADARLPVARAQLGAPARVRAHSAGGRVGAAHARWQAIALGIIVAVFIASRACCLLRDFCR